MQAFHSTSLAAYRQPFGAVRLGENVTLSIAVWGDDVRGCSLRLWIEGNGEKCLSMQRTARSAVDDGVVSQVVDARRVGFGAAYASCVPADAVLFSVSFAPDTTGIVWYRFEIEASDGAVWKYGAREEWVTGVGDFAFGEPPSFQLTVYRPRKVCPTWYEKGIAYQIFPDRFARGADWRRRTRAALDKPHRGPQRELIEDWDRTPSYARDENSRILKWDFYGGTLEGITEKLDYLQALGITIIYLNPIFEAASNHRYDTADYLAIDPILGDEASFKTLCREAKARGISIILDGVFNHTGADSRYFNREHNYSDIGACQGEKSPYADWFTLAEDGSYASWWGVDDLPDVNETSRSFRDFICGKDGVVRRWIRAGARGWRLDVADELSDEFLAEIHEAALAERSDAVVIGEVWEDASNKRAYGELKRYFADNELDGTMNYPLRSGVLKYLRSEISAYELAQRLEELRENYPKHAFFSSLNLMGSHDRARIMTILSGAPYSRTAPAETQEFPLSSDERGLGKSRLWAASVIQMTMPGVPCVYYGDEWGLEGNRDPYNRATMPWGQEDDGVRGASRHGDKDCAAIYRNSIALRKIVPVLTSGEFEPFAPNEDVFGFWRYNGTREQHADVLHDPEERVCVLINRSLSKVQNIRVPIAPGMQVSDIITGQVLEVRNDSVEVFMWPLGTTILHIHRPRRLQRPMKRGMGVLAHITSLPDKLNAPYVSQGATIGSDAHRFVDWLEEAGQMYWQILPVNPTDECGSPYAGLSAFAGNASLLDGGASGALERFEALERNTVFRYSYQEFCKKNAYWLEPYAVFRALKDTFGEDVAWQDWPGEYRSYTPELAARAGVREGAERRRRIQFMFEREWHELRDYAHKHGVQIIGDMPMFVSADSADVWAHPEIFDLDAEGRIASQPGTPPDSFAPEGQLWGNPAYRWDVLKQQGYAWWMQRFERSFDLYDYTRLDHFLGFISYYDIPSGHTAADGSDLFGPGLDLFQEAHRRFGELPFIAEDLGSVTPAVRALLAETGIPGMSVAVFADGDPREHFVAPPETVLYTSTHDTSTLAGHIKRRFTFPDTEDAAVNGLADEKTLELFNAVVEHVLSVPNDVAILPLQDVLGLDDSARMNVPGTCKDNWVWRCPPELLTHDAAEKLRALARRGAR